MGPAVLADLVAGMGPSFIFALSAEMSSLIFGAIFGGGDAGGGSGVTGGGVTGSGGGGDKAGQGGAEAFDVGRGGSAPTEGAEFPRAGAGGGRGEVAWREGGGALGSQPVVHTGSSGGGERAAPVGAPITGKAKAE